MNTLKPFLQLKNGGEVDFDAMSENLFKHCSSKKKELVKIEDAGHAIAFLVNEEKYINAVKNFFN